MTDAGRAGGDSRSLGRRLRDAREARHWDLARAERETRIRARYLHALEEGAYRELPSPVYTAGFVRNYARYLGLNPEECVSLYHREAPPDDTPAPIQAPPRPIEERARGTVVFTTRRVTIAALIGLVAVFAAYLVYQFATFAGTPEITLIDPATDLAAYDGTTYTLRGETVPNAEITVDGLPENPTATANADGAFTIPVVLVPGSNVITLVATDPVTGRTSDPLERTITVTLPPPTPVPSVSPLPSGAAVRQDRDTWPTSRSTS